MKLSIKYLISVFIIFSIFNEADSQLSQTGIIPQQPTLWSDGYLDLTTNSSDSVYREWIKYYGQSNSSSWDWANAITVGCEGNVYVVGVRYFGRYLTLKYNRKGDLLWVGGKDNDPVNGEINAIAVDGSGNVYVTGRNKESAGTEPDYATVKYSPDGIEQWIARYNGPVNGYDEAVAIALDNDGNIYVTGESSGAGTSRDYLTIKYNPDGVEQWVARYDGPGVSIDIATAIIVDGNGNSYVTGYIRGASTPTDILTIKYNTDGVEQWSVRYDGIDGDNDKVEAMEFDRLGYIILTESSVNTATGADFLTLKYDTEGLKQWHQTYDGPNNGKDEATDIVLDRYGNIYVTGRSAGPDDENAAVKYDPNGVVKWIARYGRHNFKESTKIAVDEWSNVYVIGNNAPLIKYNAIGEEQWRRGFGDYIAIDYYGHLYITFPDFDPDGDWVRIGIAKYVQTTWLKSEKLSVTEGYASPGLDSVVITTRLPGSSNFKVDSKIEQNECLAIETIQLFDDGMHHDGEAGDSLFGNIWAVPSGVESNYFVDLFVTVTDTNTITYKKNNAARFTTIGPIQYSDQQFNTSRDPYPNPGDISLMRLSLGNFGTATTASMITADVFPLDSCVTRVLLRGSNSYGDIPPAETAWTIGEYGLFINENCSGGINASLKVDIFSENEYFWSDTFSIHIYPIGINDNLTDLPEDYFLSNAYPNPFNPVTNIEYALPKSGKVRLSIFNILGNEVAILVESKQSAGFHSVSWDASNVASGIYFYRLTSGNFVATKKMVLLK